MQSMIRPLESLSRAVAEPVRGLSGASLSYPGASSIRLQHARPYSLASSPVRFGRRQCPQVPPALGTPNFLSGHNVHGGQLFFSRGAATSASSPRKSKDKKLTLRWGPDPVKTSNKMDRGSPSRPSSSPRGSDQASTSASTATSTSPESSSPAASSPTSSSSSSPKRRLEGDLRRRVRRLNLERATAVQDATFQAVLEGRDVLAVAAPGAGKTLAYLLPLLQKVAEDTSIHDTFLVLHPTRAAAERTFLMANRLKELQTKVALLYGSGTSGGDGYHTQNVVVRQGAHIAVGTPGRVLQLLNSGALIPSNIRGLVLDDAEELFVSRTQHETKALLQYLQGAGAAPRARQWLIFANALTERLEAECGELLSQELRVDLSSVQQALPAGIQHKLLEIPGGATKRARALAWLLEEQQSKLSKASTKSSERSGSSSEQSTSGSERTGTPSEKLENSGTPSLNLPVSEGCQAAAAEAEQQELRGAGRGIVFVGSRAEVSLLSSHASLRHRTVGLHGEAVGQEQALAAFRSSEHFALITTDLAARTLDLPPVNFVVHMGAPSSSDTYTLRCSLLKKGLRSPGKGSTSTSSASSASSASAEGPESIVVHTAHQLKEIKELERHLGRKFTSLASPSEEALRLAAVSAIARELAAATLQYDVEAFAEDAAQQLDLHGPRILAAGLVLLERRRRGEEWVSPLSGRARYTPLLFVDPYLEHLQTRRSVAAAVDRASKRSGSGGGPLHHAAARSGSRSRAAQSSSHGVGVGRVELTPRGWVADVPNAQVNAVLKDPWLQSQNVAVLPLSKLPQLLPDSAAAEQETRKGPRKRRSRRQRLNQLSEKSEARRKMKEEFLHPPGPREPFGAPQKAGLAKRAIGT